MGLTRKEKYNAKHSSRGRLWGFNRIAGAQDGKTEIYMTRAWIGRLRFHLFHRGDQDPDCHDHPWGFWTFPLRSYVEEVLRERRESHFYTRKVSVYYERELRVVKAFRWHYRPATYRHRVLGPASEVEKVQKEGLTTTGLSIKALIPTIVWRERESREWGFTKEREAVWCWVPWKTYVYEGGKHGPCE